MQSTAQNIPVWHDSNQGSQGKSDAAFSGKASPLEQQPYGEREKQLLQRNPGDSRQKNKIIGMWKHR
jgi:hypothetical protein